MCTKTNKQLILQKSLKQIARRKRYVYKLETNNQVIMLGDNADMIEDTYNIFDDITFRLQREKLYSALRTLSSSELELIYAIYYSDISLRQYAKKIQIAPSTCCARKDKILRKLRIFIENEKISA